MQGGRISHLSWHQVLHRDLKASFSKKSYLSKETVGYEWTKQLEELREEQKGKCGERNLWFYGLDVGIWLDVCKPICSKISCFIIRCGNIYYVTTPFILLKARVTSTIFLKHSLFSNAYCHHPEAALSSDASRGGASDRP